MKTLAILVVVAALSPWSRAADPEGFALWKSRDVRKSARELALKIDDQKFAWLSLANYDNHLIGISHREGDGCAELHQKQVDILIVEEGAAALVIGGQMVDPKTVKPNEVRGSSIEGGDTKQITAGDIVHIPANVPHQLKIRPGQIFTYLVIKVDSM